MEKFNSKYCFVCGRENKDGFGLTFYKKGNHIETTVKIPGRFNGYKDIVHGGIISTLLDEVMNWTAYALSKNRRYCVTAEMTVRLKKSIPVGKELLLWGEMVEDKKRMRICQGKVLIGDEIFAIGMGKLVPVKDESLLKE
jgi:acyl-coenzyme A thioesterase PaaI-like protein